MARKVIILKAGCLLKQASNMTGKCLHTANTHTILKLGEKEFVYAAIR